MSNPHSLKGSALVKALAPKPGLFYFHWSASLFQASGGILHPPYHSALSGDRAGGP